MPVPEVGRDTTGRPEHGTLRAQCNFIFIGNSLLAYGGHVEDQVGSGRSWTLMPLPLQGYVKVTGVTIEREILKLLCLLCGLFQEYNVNRIIRLG